MGVFKKTVDLSSTQGALCTVSVFFILHFSYFGGAYAPTRTPLLTGLLICPTVHSQLFTLLLHSSTRTQKPFIAKFHYTGPTGPDPTTQSPRTLSETG